MTATSFVPDDLTDVRVGDTVVATYRPQWNNKTGGNYTITDVVWQLPMPATSGRLMVGDHFLAGAVSVDIVERAS
jgi:hypothetical protein